MQKIKLLEKDEILKIAAGQVVDRPANIVKELVENSIDAQANCISVYIQNGGKELIRIVDNGCGMSRQDAKMSFKKHATSKICRLDDLNKIQTFGFRGEALASISAVSKVTLLTKDQASKHGIQLEVENGNILSESDIPFTTGTDIKATQLFYNVPARQKFLKKKETENRHITQLFHSFCLDYLDIHFKLYIDSRQTLNCPPTTDIMARCSQIWGHKFAENMLPIEREKQEAGIKINGAVSNHHYFRYDRSNIFFFVNNRWIRNNQLSKSLLNGYTNVLPPSKYPCACIFVQVDPNAVDINIHPRKEEVKFLHPRIIGTLLQSSVKRALEDNLSAQLNKEVTIKPDSGPQYSRPISSPQKSFRPFNFDSFLRKNPDPLIHQEKESPPMPSAAIQTTLQSHIPAQTTHSTPETSSAKIETQATMAPETTHEKYAIIGHFKKTYILIEKSNGIFFIDQHAAHERILYELFSKRFEEVATIKLLFPQIFSITEEEMHLLEDNLDIFRKNSIAIEPFGQNQLIVKSTPIHLKEVNIQELVQEVCSWIKEYQQLDPDQFFKKINEKIHAQMACKAAIKAGDSLTLEQMNQLLHDLEKIDNRLTCPHGRPTGWLLALEDIEKKFKRRL